jgi:hypothetical protein
MNANNVPRLIVAWTIVGVPLIWGVSQVVVKSMALFN